MKARVSLYLATAISLFALTVGCAKAPNDAEIQSGVQSKFSQDSGLQGKQLAVQSSNGVVTLSGTVDNQIQRDAAARQAAAMPGVKEVINNLQVGAPAMAQADQAEPNQPAVTEPPKAAYKPRASAPRKRSLPKASSEDDVTTTRSASTNTAYVAP